MKVFSLLDTYHILCYELATTLGFEHRRPTIQSWIPVIIFVDVCTVYNLYSLWLGGLSFTTKMIIWSEFLSQTTVFDKPKSSLTMYIYFIKVKLG